MSRAAWKDWMPPDPAPPPELVPIFGVRTFDAQTTCKDIHPHGPIPSGSRCCCMACHSSGVEARTRTHIKPGNGQIREEWQTPEPTRYTPKPGLKGGVGQ